MSDKYYTVSVVHALGSSEKSWFFQRELSKPDISFTHLWLIKSVKMEYSSGPMLSWEGGSGGAMLRGCVWYK